jgi:hypothetical protein
MRSRFTTIRDLVAAVYYADPMLFEELGEQRVEEIACEVHTSRYEDIDDEEFDMILAQALREAVGM